MKYFLTALLASTLSVVGYAATITFDTADDYTDNFGVNTPITDPPGNEQTLDYVYNSGTGVGGTAGFLNIGNNTTHGTFFNYFSTGLTKTAGTIYETSYLIKIGTPANDINDYRAGFVRSTGSNFNGGGDSVNAYLRSDGGVSTYTIELFGDSVTTGDETAQFSLTADTWYQFNFQMTLNSDTNVDISSALYNRGADGTGSATLVTGSSISTSSISLALGGGFNGTDVFSGFTTRNNTGSVGQGMDNYSFVAIPEPGTLALVGIALGALAVMRRRK